MGSLWTFWTHLCPMLAQLTPRNLLTCYMKYCLPIATQHGISTCYSALCRSLHQNILHSIELFAIDWHLAGTIDTGILIEQMYPNIRSAMGSSPLFSAVSLNKFVSNFTFKWMNFYFKLNLTQFFLMNSGLFAVTRLWKLNIYQHKLWSIIISK